MPHLLLEILAFSGVATLIVTACHYIKLPSIVGFIFTGLAIGPGGVGLVSELPSAYSLTEIAGIILLFTIGLEFSFARLRDLRHQFFRLGTMQVMLTIILVTGFGLWLTDHSLKKMVLWGFLISLSSTALVLKLLHDYREVKTPHGQNSLGILLFQDVVVIPMMLILPFLVPYTPEMQPFDLNAVMLWLGKVVLVGLIIIFLAKIGLPFVLEKVIKTRSKEIFFFSIVFICLGIGSLFHEVGLSLSLGAFVAGVVIADSAFAHQAMSVFGSLRDTFLGIFFAAVGMLLDLNFIIENALVVVGLGFGLFLVKCSVVIAVCLFNRVSLSHSILTALTVCQVGEFSFLLVSEATRMGALDTIDNQYFLSISVLSMMATPFLYLLAPKIALSPMLRPKKGASLSEGAGTWSQQLAVDEADVADAGHTIVIGYGIAGKNLVEALTSIKIPYQVIEMNYEVVKKQKKEGIAISFGDATHRDVLLHAGLDNAKLVVIVISSPQVVPHIMHAIRVERPDIPIVVRTQYVQDLKVLKLDPQTTTVVAELETATELVANLLKFYGIDPETIYDFTVKARTQSTLLAHASSNSRYNVFDLPTWDALSSIRPFVLRPTDYAVDRPIVDLALPRNARGSIVSVFREGKGTQVPEGHFVLKARDILHVIGEPDCFSVVEQILRVGPTSA